MSYLAVGDAVSAATVGAIIDTIVRTFPRADAYPVDRLKDIWDSTVAISQKLADQFMTEMQRASNFGVMAQLSYFGNNLSGKTTRYATKYSQMIVAAKRAGQTMMVAPDFKNDTLAVLIEIKTADEALSQLNDIKPWYLTVLGDWLIEALARLGQKIRNFLSTGLDLAKAPFASIQNFMKWIVYGSIAVGGIWLLTRKDRR